MNSLGGKMAIGMQLVCMRLVCVCVCVCVCQCVCASVVYVCACIIILPRRTLVCSWLLSLFSDLSSLCLFFGGFSFLSLLSRLALSLPLSSFLRIFFLNPTLLGKQKTENRKQKIENKTKNKKQNKCCEEKRSSFGKAV